MEQAAYHEHSDTEKQNVPNHSLHSQRALQQRQQVQPVISMVQSGRS